MKKENATKTGGQISDEAVKERTGKSWAEWFALLDAVGARELGHAAIAALLFEKLGCPGWWNQMVAVTYEQERGLRQQYETADGYQVSRGKTFAVAVAALYAAWDDAKQRGRWLKGAAKMVVRKATPPKSMRITWTDGTTSVEVNFYAKGKAKSQVTVQHRKLAGADEVERMRAYWGEALERLAKVLEADGAE